MEVFGFSLRKRKLKERKGKKENYVLLERKEITKITFHENILALFSTCSKSNTRFTS